MDDLYIVKNSFSNRIKIGHSNNFKTRRKTIINTGGCELQNIHIQSNEGNLEKKLHRVFREYNTKIEGNTLKEWFEYKGLLKSFLIYINENNKKINDELIERLYLIKYCNKEYLNSDDSFEHLCNLFNSVFLSFKEAIKKLKNERENIGYGLKTSNIDILYKKRCSFRYHNYELIFEGNKVSFNLKNNYSDSNIPSEAESQLHQIKINTDPLFQKELRAYEKDLEDKTLRISKKFIDLSKNELSIILKYDEFDCFDDGDSNYRFFGTSIEESNPMFLLIIDSPINDGKSYENYLLKNNREIRGIY